MLRLRALFPPLALLLLLAGAGSAAPVRADRDTLDRGTPAPRVQSAVLVEELRTLPRVRLFLAEVTILPSGRTVTRAIPVLPLRADGASPLPPDLIVLPLPAAMPLFLAALAGLALAGRSRRGGPLARAAPRS
jgi:hypothetical protein